MRMKCIAVYTKDFGAFSDIFEKVLESEWNEGQEAVIDGVTVSGSGEVPAHYMEKMRRKRKVVVMKERERDITILQHGEMFEILIPAKEEAVL